MKNLGIMKLSPHKHLGIFTGDFSFVQNEKQEVVTIVYSFYAATSTAYAHRIMQWSLDQLDTFPLTDLDDLAIWEMDTSWRDNNGLSELSRLETIIQ